MVDTRTDARREWRCHSLSCSSQLKKRISSLSQIIALQNKLIVELNGTCAPYSLYNSRDDTDCDEGRRRCKIQHSKYNYRRPQFKEVEKSLFLAAKQDETIFFKQMSKKIDITQSKYGTPSRLYHKILVASDETITISN